MLLHVVGIEISSVDDHEMANTLIALRNAGERDGMFDAIDDNFRVHVARAGNFDDAGNCVLNGAHVGERNFITERSGFAGGVHGVGINDVGADAFNLSDDELPADE